LWCWSNDGAGVISSLLLVVGLLCCLVYFIFSVEQNRPLRIMARTGTWFLMIGFGASFGFTVMGRIALAIGRGEELLGRNLTEAEYAQVHPRLVSVLIALVIIVLLAWWRTQAPGDSDDNSPSTGSEEPIAANNSSGE